jgi:hypothetical protein
MRKKRRGRKPGSIRAEEILLSPAPIARTRACAELGEEAAIC